MKRFMKVQSMVVALALFALSGCGGSPAPAPAPPSQYPNGYAGYGSCGAVGGGQPLQPGPINGTLTDQNGTVVGSITLNLFLSSQYYASDPNPSIVGSGNIAFSDSSYLSGGYYPTPGQQTSFCISSQDPNGGGLYPGVYGQQDSSIALMMKGIANIPAISPYSGYPAGSSAPEPVTVSIGYDCAAYLSGNTRFQGCVRVEIGSGGYGMIFWAN